MPVFNKLKKMSDKDNMKESDKRKLLAERQDDETESSDNEDVAVDAEVGSDEEEIEEGEMAYLEEENSEEDEDESEEEGSEEEGSEEEDAAPAPVDVNFVEPAAWAERMSLTAVKTLPSDLSPNDDPKREEVFLQQATISVLRGLHLLEKAGIPWRRPEDYYAEMYKSDVQMEKIRDSICKEKDKVQQRVQRRAMKDQKKFGKEVQAEVLRQRSKHKREMSDRLSDWKKKRKGNEPRDKLDDVIDNMRGQDEARGGRGGRGGGRGGRGGRGGGGGRGGSQGARKSLKPGGAKRPGKNRRKSG